MDDHLLLTRYSVGGSEEAFKEIVERYWKQVYACCYRRLAGDHASAEEAAQATFIVLMKKAETFGNNKKSLLLPWLYKVAHLVILEKLRSEKSRRNREMEAAMKNQNEKSGPQWQEISPCIDEMVDGLSKNVRTSVILHYSAGWSVTEIAERLSVTEYKARKWISTGLEKIKNKLVGSNIDIRTSVLSTLMLEKMAEIPGTSLSEPVFQTILTAQTAGAVTPAAHLAQGAMKMMFISKVKKISAAALIILTGGIYSFAGVRGSGEVERQGHAEIPEQSAVTAPEIHAINDLAQAPKGAHDVLDPIPDVGDVRNVNLAEKPDEKNSAHGERTPYLRVDVKHHRLRSKIFEVPDRSNLSSPISFNNEDNLLNKLEYEVKLHFSRLRKDQFEGEMVSLKTKLDERREGLKRYEEMLRKGEWRKIAVEAAKIDLQIWEDEKAEQMEKYPDRTTAHIDKRIDDNKEMIKNPTREYAERHIEKLRSRIKIDEESITRNTIDTDGPFYTLAINKTESKNEATIFSRTYTVTRSTPVPMQRDAKGGMTFTPPRDFQSNYEVIPRQNLFTDKFREKIIFRQTILPVSRMEKQSYTRLSAAHEKLWKGFVSLSIDEKTAYTNFPDAEADMSKIVYQPSSSENGLNLTVKFPRQHGNCMTSEELCQIVLTGSKNSAIDIFSSLMKSETRGFRLSMLSGVNPVGIETSTDSLAADIADSERSLANFRDGQKNSNDPRQGRMYGGLANTEAKKLAKLREQREKDQLTSSEHPRIPAVIEKIGKMWTRLNYAMFTNEKKYVYAVMLDGKKFDVLDGSGASVHKGEFKDTLIAKEIKDDGDKTQFELIADGLSSYKTEKHENAAAIKAEWDISKDDPKLTLEAPAVTAGTVRALIDDGKRFTQTQILFRPGLNPIGF